jgi:hypothetical protein
MGHASRFGLLALIAALALPIAGLAEPIPKQKGPERTVRMFDFYCLSRLPDLDSVARTAGFGEYDQLTGEDAKPFAPAEPSEGLQAWRFHDQGDRFVLTAYRTASDAAITADAPAFKGVPAAVCSFHIPASNPAGVVAELTKLLGRPADKVDSVQGTHTWNLQTPNVFSQVRFSVPAADARNAVLSGLVLLKAQ